MKMKPGLALLLFPLLLACSPIEEHSLPFVVTSIYPIEFIASYLGEGQIETKNLTPNGGEPHDYELTPKDVAAMSDAEAVFINGLGMESYENAFPGYIKKKTVNLSDEVPTKTVAGKVDPHIFLSLSAYKSMAGKIKETLLKIDGINAAKIEQRYVSFIGRVDSLYRECEALALNISPKTIVVSHAAYGYMFDQFGLEQLYVSGLSPEEEPSPKALESILDAMKEKGIKTVYFEETASSEVAASIAAYTGAKVATLSAIESRSESQRESNKDYFDIYLDNFITMAGGKA